MKLLNTDDGLQDSVAAQLDNDGVFNRMSN